MNICCLFLHSEQLNFEIQRCVRGDIRGSSGGSVSHLRGNDKLAFPSDLHAFYPAIPTLDNLSGAQFEREGLFSDGAVEFFAPMAIYIKPAGVMDGDGQSLFGCFSGSGYKVLFLQFGRSTGRAGDPRSA